MSGLTPELSTGIALEYLMGQIGKDPEYRAAWVANIAVQFQDAMHGCELTDVHEASNEAANNFLDMMIRLTKQPELLREEACALLNKHRWSIHPVTKGKGKGICCVNCGCFNSAAEAREPCPGIVGLPCPGTQSVTS